MDLTEKGFNSCISWCLSSYFVYIKEDYTDWDCADNKGKSFGEPGMPKSFRYVETTNEEDVNNFVSVCMMEIMDLNLAVTWFTGNKIGTITESRNKTNSWKTVDLSGIY